MTYVLGINAYHGDASGCIVRDGMLVAAAEEERFRRIKHRAGFPTESIRYCLSGAGIGLADLYVLGFNPDSGATPCDKGAYIATRRPEISLVLDRLRNKRERMGAAGALAPPFSGEILRPGNPTVAHPPPPPGSAVLGLPS